MWGFTGFWGVFCHLKICLIFHANLAMLYRDYIIGGARAAREIELFNTPISYKTTNMKFRYQCEIISDEIPDYKLSGGRSFSSYSFFVRITSIEDKPQDFETVIGFSISACEGYDNETRSYPSHITKPLEMISITDRIEFYGTPYNKQGTPTLSQSAKDIFWIAVDPTLPIKRLPPTLKSAHQLLKYFKKEKKEERRRKRKNKHYLWSRRIRGGIGWIKSQLPTIIVAIIGTVIGGLILYFLIVLLKE